MSRYAVMQGDTVVNIVRWDGRSKFNGGELLLVPDECSIGWTRSSEGWQQPPPPAEVVESIAETEARAEARSAALASLSSKLNLTEEEAQVIAGG
jgi:hypothetical protein